VAVLPRERAGRRAIRTAITASSSAAASVIMWAASASSASDCAAIPAMISQIMNATIRANAASSHRRSASSDTRPCV
jgi:hypothetical protein